MECNICKRSLQEVNDPLSDDCGGNCLGCVIIKGTNYSNLAVRLAQRVMELEGRLKKISSILLDHAFNNIDN